MVGLRPLQTVVKTHYTKLIESVFTVVLYKNESCILSKPLRQNVTTTKTIRRVASTNVLKSLPYDLRTLTLVY